MLPAALVQVSTQPLHCSQQSPGRAALLSSTPERQGYLDVWLTTYTHELIQALRYKQTLAPTVGGRILHSRSGGRPPPVERPLHDEFLVGH